MLGGFNAELRVPAQSRHMGYQIEAENIPDTNTVPDVTQRVRKGVLMIGFYWLV